MTMSPDPLTKCSLIFPTADLARTAAYYRDTFGFWLSEHYDNAEPFVAAYRGEVEIILLQIQQGEVLPNHQRYGAGYDAYLVVDQVPQDVDRLYAELSARGAKIVQPPFLTAYGNYELVVEDNEGRRLCMGRILQEDVYWKDRK
jgi:uncharacterized glyoxalase superfamily protein PhnB